MSETNAELIAQLRSRAREGHYADRGARYWFSKAADALEAAEAGRDAAGGSERERLSNIALAYLTPPKFAAWSWAPNPAALADALIAEGFGDVAQAWDDAYQQGIEDERTSEDNIGLEGWGVKSGPNRNNPHRAS